MYPILKLSLFARDSFRCRCALLTTVDSDVLEQVSPLNFCRRRFEGLNDALTMAVTLISPTKNIVRILGETTNRASLLM